MAQTNLKITESECLILVCDIASELIATHLKTSCTASRESVVVRGCLIDKNNVSPQPQIPCGSYATPTQPVIYPLNLPSIQWREDWCKAFLPL